MSDRYECPECGSHDTERVHADLDWDNVVETIRICNNCPTQYTLVFGPFSVVDVVKEDGMGMVSDDE